ncbi:MAG: HAMP domain-containing sensor histidine kinase [Planctomycetota bacterium]
MATNDLNKLASLISQERDAMLVRWRLQVRQLPSAKQLDTPTLNDHIPGFLDELVLALRERSTETIAQAVGETSPPAHGLQRVQDGFDIEEVVAEYNILRGCIHDLAEENQLNLQGQAFHILNRALDGAIGMAVQTYATQKALEVQNRREEYLAFVAHDLRTPLNAISLAARVVELSLPDRSAEMSQMLNTLRRNVQHLEALVGKVIEENTHLQTEIGLKIVRRNLDLWPLVESLIHDLHPVSGTSSTKLTNNVPENLVAFADASLLRRVFQNLIANSIKYTPRGEISIGAQCQSDDGTVECWVIDNGTGIEPDRLEKIFDKLETDHHDGGIGLGLAIVKTFVEAHGGQVTVISQEGHGATFRFTLPPRVNR